MAPPGTTSVEVEVYDVGKKVEGIEVVADIMRFQASQGQLQVERTFAVNNTSKPPRTQMNEHNLEFYVPDGATVTEGQAMTAGGQPVNSAPVPEGDNAKNRYAFLFPLAPRRDPLQRRLHRSLHRQREYRSQERLSSGTFRRHRAQDDGVLRRSRNQLSSRSVSPASPTPTWKSPPTRNWASPWHSNSPAKAPWPRPPKKSGVSPARRASLRAARKPPRRRPRTAHRRSRPPCRNIAGGFSAASPPPCHRRSLRRLAPASRQPRRPRQRQGLHDRRGRRLRRPTEVPVEPRARASDRAATRGAVSSSSRPPPHSSMLLEALKEELFQLEVEHKQGRITQQEYESAKSALDQTLQRALKREAQKA